MGGYKIIDLKGNNFKTNDMDMGIPIEIKGINKAIEESKKLIILSNFSVGGVKALPVALTFTQNPGYGLWGEFLFGNTGRVEIKIKYDQITMVPKG